MELIYSNRKKLSPNVIEALKYIAKVGVITKHIWNESFSHGTSRWKLKQLTILLTNKILKHHRCELGDFYVLGDRGIEFAKAMEWSLVDPVSPTQIRHDEIIGYGLLKLERSKTCKSWKTEKELKVREGGHFLIRDQAGQKKFPDSICEMFMGGKYRLVAVEYERNGKTIPRYRSILWSYNKMTNLSMVLFIVEDEVIKKRIKKSLRYLGSVPLIEQVAFMSVKEWKNDPFRGTIELSSIRTNFEKLSLVN